MNNELKSLISENAAYVEDSNFEFEGLDLEFHGKTDGVSAENYHVAPRDENGKIHIGKISGRFEGFIGKEGWNIMFRAIVEITIAELKAAPELIKPLFCLGADLLRAIIEEKRQAREIRRMELELELERMKKSLSKGQTPKANQAPKANVK